MKGHVITGFAATVLGMVMAASSAYALSLAPADADWTTNDNSNLNAAQVSALTGVSGLVELYKQNVGGGEEKPLAGSYSTSFSSPVSGDGVSGFTVTYTGGTSFVCPECLLLVKDGRQEPAQYVFDLGNWNGTESITGSGFWAGRQGAISHASIYQADPGTAVPEPASLLLLGAGLVGLGIWKRKVSKI